VRVGLDDRGAVVVTVADDGRWRPAHSVGGGRGLALMRACADELAVDRQAAGTTVTMRLTPGHPAAFGQAVPRPGPPPPRTFDTMVVAREPTVLAVTGAVDVTSVDLLRAAIAHEPVGAGRLVLDLANVSMLASAGIQLLYELGDRVDVHAPAASPARHVLDLTGLLP